MFEELMPLKYFLFTISVMVLFSQCWILRVGAKCALKGFVNNRVQCILHDLKSVVSTEAQIHNENAIEDNLSWLRNIVKGITDEIDVAVAAKCGKTLNCSTPFLLKLTEEYKKSVVENVLGTRWCSDPSLAAPENRLTNKCCKRHSDCENVIHANQTKFGLTNTRLHSRSHCDCDKEFYHCLKAVNDMVSQEIGYTYFTVLEPQCFKIEYPILKCLSKTVGRCIEYEFNMEARKRYQWFDNPLY